MSSEKFFPKAIDQEMERILQIATEYSNKLENGELAMMRIDSLSGIKTWRLYSVDDDPSIPCLMFPAYISPDENS